VPLLDLVAAVASWGKAWNTAEIAEVGLALGLASVLESLLSKVEEIVA
jgi:hypothetical protein